jgi:hypothetical protein
MNDKRVLVGATLLFCALALAALGLRADEPVLDQEWRRLIVSPNWDDRARAADLVLQERRATISALMEILDMPVQPNESFYSSGTPRNTAIRLLGELRAAESVRALTQCLMPRPGQRIDVTELVYLGPAGRALVKMGMPAVPAVLDILASVGVSSEWKGTTVSEPDRVHVRFVGPPLERSSPLGDECLKILVRIKGLEETEVGLRRYIASETHQARKKNLEDALAALSRPNLRQVMLAFQAQEEAMQRTEWAGWWTREAEKQAREKALQAQPQPEQVPPAR